MECLWKTLEVSLFFWGGKSCTINHKWIYHPPEITCCPRHEHGHFFSKLTIGGYEPPGFDVVGWSTGQTPQCQEIFRCQCKPIMSGSWMCMGRTDTTVWSTRVSLTTERELCSEVTYCPDHRSQYLSISQGWLESWCGVLLQIPSNWRMEQKT